MRSGTRLSGQRRTMHAATSLPGAQFPLSSEPKPTISPSSGRVASKRRAQSSTPRRTGPVSGAASA